MLNLFEFHGCRALPVVVHHVIDPRADGVAPHEPIIIGLQQFGGCTHVRHPRIEPQVVVVGIKNDWHSVVDRGGHRVRGRGQDRAGLDPVAAPSVITSKAANGYQFKTGQRTVAGT